MTVIVVGAHPDDPEDGCGGLIARLTKSEMKPQIEEKVLVVYMTSGGAGIGGKSQTEACAIREKEALIAGEILGTESIFLALIDGAANPTAEAIDKLKNLFLDEMPRMILTHWPLDTHHDHRCAWYLVMEAYTKAFGSLFTSSIKDPFDQAQKGAVKYTTGKPAIYFFQTMPWRQSLNFDPDYLVNVDQTFDLKIEALEAHTSQNRGDCLVKDAEYNAKELAKRFGYDVFFAEGFKRLRC
jgi:LmbE family N-acetylglucosaminyl deacetylase